MKHFLIPAILYPMVPNTIHASEYFKAIASLWVTPFHHPEVAELLRRYGL
jgi:hypothetical protein